jgi:hypothetical protein
MAEADNNQPQVRVELPTKIINQDVIAHQQPDPLLAFKRRVMTVMLPPATWEDVSVGLVYHICIPGILAALVRTLVIHRVNVHWTLTLIFISLVVAVIGFCRWLWQAVPEVRYLLLARGLFVVVGILLGGRV